MAAAEEEAALRASHAATAAATDTAEAVEKVKEECRAKALEMGHDRCGRFRFVFESESTFAPAGA